MLSNYHGTPAFVCRLDLPSTALKKFTLKPFFAENDRADVKSSNNLWHALGHWLAVWFAHCVFRSWLQKRGRMAALATRALKWMIVEVCIYIIYVEYLQNKHAFRTEFFVKVITFTVVGATMDLLQFSGINCAKTTECRLTPAGCGTSHACPIFRIVQKFPQPWRLAFNSLFVVISWLKIYICGRHLDR